MIVIDNHAHSLRRDFLLMDGLDFRRVFSESSSLKVIENDVPVSAAYRRALRLLGARLGVDEIEEEEYLRLRQSMEPADFIKDLFDEVSLGAILLDDGYGGPDFISIDELSLLSGRPIHRVLRLETLMESLIEKSNDLDRLIVSMFESLSAPEVVALKTIAAYRGGFPVGDPSHAQAASELRSLSDAGGGKIRMAGGPCHHYLLRRALEQAGSMGMPVQVHCGFGDSDLDLSRCDPALLTGLFREFRKTDFVLLHCYPFVGQAAYLTSVYPNIYMDLSLASFLLPGLLHRLFQEALNVAPPTRLLAGSDGHTTPETHYLGILNTRDTLERVLGEMVAEGIMSASQAEEATASILFDNARRLYELSARG
ncbi:MAG: amidohydrolase family protein [Cyanobacteria bacterium HKST-UBA02]|nr:amidohydrolase family protein [Cyanobacteria bacterium HKST-UBA02]